MGDTVITGKMFLIEEEQQLSYWRDSLPAAYRRAFDELFIMAEWHTAAFLMIEHRPRPEALHMLLAVTMMKEILDLGNRVILLEREIAGKQGPERYEASYPARVKDVGLVQR